MGGYTNRLGVQGSLEVGTGEQEVLERHGAIVTQTRGLGHFWEKGTRCYTQIGDRAGNKFES